jgi:hypothetical protein
MVTNGKEPENLNNLPVAATFEKAITYVFAESPFRNAEARSSTLLCSTTNLTASTPYTRNSSRPIFPKWLIRGQKKLHPTVLNRREWEGMVNERNMAGPQLSEA